MPEQSAIRINDADAYIGPGDSASRKHASFIAAIIQQAIHDAVATKEGCNRKQYEIDEARRWFAGNHRWFRHYCHLIGLDPVAVRERVLMKIREAENA